MKSSGQIRLVAMIMVLRCGAKFRMSPFKLNASSDTLIATDTGHFPDN
jgi:hypothetical protein